MVVGGQLKGRSHAQNSAVDLVCEALRTCHPNTKKTTSNCPFQRLASLFSTLRFAVTPSPLSPPIQTSNSPEKTHPPIR